MQFNKQFRWALLKSGYWFCQRSVIIFVFEVLLSFLSCDFSGPFFHLIFIYAFPLPTQTRVAGSWLLNIVSILPLRAFFASIVCFFTTLDISQLIAISTLSNTNLCELWSHWWPYTEHKIISSTSGGKRNKSLEQTWFKLVI